MGRLLYVEASPRKDRSISSFAATEFLKSYRERNPADEIDRLDVWDEPLPEFDRDAFEAKYAGIEGDERTPAQAAAWARFEALARRFIDADKILISVPMWNFTIPYKLKQLIDVVSQKDLLFTFDERGLNGLLSAKTFMIYSRGIAYNAASGTPPEIWDHQRRYLELWLRSVGISDIGSLVIESTFLGANRDAIAAEAYEAALSF